MLSVCISEKGDPFLSKGASSLIKHICLIDDEDFFLVMQENLLQSENCKVTSFNRFNRFLDFLNSETQSSQGIDLILTDRFFKEEGIDLLHDSYIPGLRQNPGPMVLHSQIFLWSNSLYNPGTTHGRGFDKIIAKDLYTLSELTGLLSEKTELFPAFACSEENSSLITTAES